MLIPVKFSDIVSERIVPLTEEDTSVIEEYIKKEIPLFYCIEQKRILSEGGLYVADAKYNPEGCY